MEPTKHWQLSSRFISDASITYLPVSPGHAVIQNLHRSYAISEKSSKRRPFTDHDKAAKRVCVEHPRITGCTKKWLRNTFRVHRHLDVDDGGRGLLVFDPSPNLQPVHEKKPKNKKALAKVTIHLGEHLRI